jgi:hypothetical protein
MAHLVDTCGWIEWLTDGLLADDFAPYMANPVELLIPRPLCSFNFINGQNAKKGKLKPWARLP